MSPNGYMTGRTRQRHAFEQTVGEDLERGDNHKSPGLGVSVTPSARFTDQVLDHRLLINQVLFDDSL